MNLDLGNYTQSAAVYALEKKNRKFRKWNDSIIQLVHDLSFGDSDQESNLRSFENGDSFDAKFDIPTEYQAELGGSKIVWSFVEHDTKVSGSYKSTTVAIE